MAGLGGREYRAVLDLVGEIHDAQDLPDFRAMLIPALRRAVPAEFSSYNEVKGAGEVLAVMIEPEVPEWARPVWDRHAGQNPLLARHVRTRDGRAYRFSDLMPAAELHRLPLYEEFYRPLGVEHQIAFALPCPAPLTVGVALSRGPRERDFTNAEREMLDLARPHLIQAYRNAQLRERVVELVEAVKLGATRAGSALVVVAPDRTVELATPAAVRLAAAFGPGLREGDPLPRGLAEFLGGVHTATAFPSQEGTVLVRRVRGAGEGGTSVLLMDDARRMLSADALEGLGLTGREAEVLAGLAHGGDSDVLAAQMGISVRTVHKHLERIHAKLGVSTRAQAVATAWAAVAATAVTLGT